MTQSLITSVFKKSSFVVLFLMVALLGCSKQQPTERQPEVSTYSVTVNYTHSLPEMIAAGKYEYANDDITTEHFPAKGEGKKDLEIVLVHFDKYMESEDVLKELDKLGLRAATLPELLAFGEKYPHVQRDFPIIALGSVWQGPDGNRHVPYLDSWSDRRGLCLLWFEIGWGGGCRFAAVRK